MYLFSYLKTHLARVGLIVLVLSFARVGFTTRTAFTAGVFAAKYEFFQNTKSALNTRAFVCLHIRLIVSRNNR